jgi:hypothetical protein
MLEYLLERFLYRLSIHPLGRQHFVLKGGLLLAQFGARRITRDIDILGRAFPGDEQEIIRRITQIASTAIDDGVAFEPDTLTTVPIEYPQYLTGETFTLYGYPIATIIAEKLSTAIALGDLNTRDRDYADLHQLITRHHLDGDELTAALRNTASHRGIQLRPLSEAISDLPTRRQAPTPHGDDAKATQPRTTPQPSPTSSPPSPRSPTPWQPVPRTGRTWDPATRAWQAT